MNLLSSDGKQLQPRLTDQAIRDIGRRLRATEALLNMMPKVASAPLTGSGPITTVEQVKRELQAGGNHPLNVQSLLGRVAQPQVAFAPWLLAAPTPSDPQSQDGSLYVDTTNGLQGFDGTTAPGVWRAVPVAATAFGSTAAHKVLVGPTSGSAVPTFRLLTETDLPPLLDVDITPVAVNAAVTTDQNLMSFVIPAGVLNTVGKVLRVTCYGNLDEDTGPTITFKLKLSSTLLTWTPSTPGATKTGLSWHIGAYLVTQSTGVNANFEVHGTCGVDSNNTGGSVTQDQLDRNAAAGGAVDLTANQTLQITIAFSTSLATNVGRQRTMILELMN